MSTFGGAVAVDIVEGALVIGTVQSYDELLGHGHPFEHFSPHGQLVKSSS